jgi:hypothetical protein
VEISQSLRQGFTFYCSSFAAGLVADLEGAVTPEARSAKKAVNRRRYLRRFARIGALLGRVMKPRRALVPHRSPLEGELLRRGEIHGATVTDWGVPAEGIPQTDIDQVRAKMHEWQTMLNRSLFGTDHEPSWDEIRSGARSKLLGATIIGNSEDLQSGDDPHGAIKKIWDRD